MTTQRQSAPKQKTTATPKKILPSSKASPKEKKPMLPVNELNAWLEKHHHWNHDQWLTLLADLEAKGHKDFLSTEEGRHEVGRYLEKHRH